MFTFDKLPVLLAQNRITKTDLVSKYGMNTRVVAKLFKNEPVSMKTLDELCRIFQCQPNEIMEWVDEEAESDAAKE